MRKLIESTFVSLDGVISEPADWGVPYWDDEHNHYAHDLLFAADTLLLGRVTYEGFAQAWPTRSGDDYSDRINARHGRAGPHADAPRPRR
jgi:dihydrofolate reductase